MRTYLLAIGVMTGNSLDGADAVLTRFNQDGDMEDLKTHGKKLPPDLSGQLRQFRQAVADCQGDMPEAIKRFDGNGAGSFNRLHDCYINFVAGAINELVQISRQDGKLASKYNLDQIDLIGFHGQTCAHFPPSIAGTDNPDVVYTCQLGDGQLLADLTNIPVIYDFRSDDLMNGGEAAPLAPFHHKHIAEQMKRQGWFPVAICNGGNTGNFTVVSFDGRTGESALLGWDTGPFNNYPDMLMQSERNQACDWDGRYGLAGGVNENLLRLLFEKAALTNDGKNFLLMKPPRSSDPQWYKLLPELSGRTPVEGQILNFEDRLRTAEYFAAYAYIFALTMLPEQIQAPRHYALCGGGWKNPLVYRHFTELMQGQWQHNPILPEHRKAFERWHERIHGQGSVTIDLSNRYGFDGTAMEARIMADAAVCRVKGQAFTGPGTTGARYDTICGIIRFPSGSRHATAALAGWLEAQGSRDLTYDNPVIFDPRWSRAAAGWHSRLAKVRPG